jgi:hypothetical protein
MLAIIIAALWIGSAVAGWYLFWPWLIVPVACYGLYVARAMAGIRSAQARNGIPADARTTGMMHRANAELIVKALLQHLAIFGATAGLHWLL